MKQMKRRQDIKAMSPDELQDELLQLKKEQYKLRFQQASGQLEKTHRVREVRRDIARIRMILAAKGAAAEAAAQAS